MAFWKENGGKLAEIVPRYSVIRRLMQVLNVDSVQVVDSKMVKQKWIRSTHCVLYCIVLYCIVLYCDAVKNDGGLFLFLVRH